MPALPRILAAGLAAVAVSAPATAHAASCAGAGRDVSSSGVAAASKTTLCLLNVQRRHHGLRALKASAVLARPATAHSAAMVRKSYFEHGNFVSRLTSYTSGAQWWTIGENIAWGGGSLGTPGEIVTAWMHSPGHRANILSHAYRQIGVGIVLGTPVGMPGATYTTDFGARH